MPRFDCLAHRRPFKIVAGSIAGDYLGSADDGVLSGYGMVRQAASARQRGRSGEQAISCILRGVMRGDRISGKLELDGIAVPFNVPDILRGSPE